MAMYSFTANDVSQSTPVLQKGPVSIYAAVNIYFVVGENPIANRQNCALIRAGETRHLKLPVKCCKIAVLAVDAAGTVTISEVSGGASSSCS
jgi:hypothetical protein